MRQACRGSRGLGRSSRRRQRGQSGTSGGRAHIPKRMRAMIAIIRTIVLNASIILTSLTTRLLGGTTYAAQSDLQLQVVSSARKTRNIAAHQL
eukprot:2117305-Pyramimonas_sp.AAC.1